MNENSSVEESMPVVSFVVPVFNVARYVRQCLESILSQTVSNIELFVIDDGSMDDSGVICDSIAASDTRVRVLHEDNTGVSHARNAGLELATGEYVCFVDSDDWLSPVFTERMLSFAKENDAPVVACGPTRVDSDGRLLWRHPVCHMVLETEPAVCGALRRDMYCGWPWNKLFKRSLLHDHRVRFDETLRYCEDLLFCVDAILLSPRLVYDSREDLYFYRENDCSANHRTIHGRRFNPLYLDRLKADDAILERSRSVSRRIFRYAKANAFVSNEDIYRKLKTVGSPDETLSRTISFNMVRLLPAILRCRGFGGLRTKCRYVWETFGAVFGRISAQEINP